MRVLIGLVILMILEIVFMKYEQYQVELYLLFWPTLILTVCRLIQVLSNTEDD